MLTPTSTASHDEYISDDNKQLRQITKELVRLFGEWQLNFGNKVKAKNYPI